QSETLERTQVGDARPRPERDGPDPERIVDALRRSVDVETAQPDQVEVAVLVAIFIRVSFRRLEAAIVIRIRPWIVIAEIRSDFPECNAHRQGFCRGFGWPA